MKTPGFTLIELLVTMAILGIIVSAIFAVQMNTMKFSATTSGQAKRMQALQEASNYVTERLRSASQVNTSLTVSGINTTTCSTATPATTCFAVVAPDAKTGNPQYLVYRVIPRNELAAGDKGPDNLADTNALALVEYRAGAASSFTAAIPASLSLSGVTPNVVLDYLTVGFTSSAATPAVFTFDQATGQAILNFQVRQMERGTQMNTPPSGPLSMTVYPKNRR